MPCVGYRQLVGSTNVHQYQLRASAIEFARQLLMGSHCGLGVSLIEASGMETPYSPSLRDAPRTGILRQALASPFGRRPHWLGYTNVGKAFLQGSPPPQTKVKLRF
ncbi:MAG: hypothetical protein V7K48_19250 [Nostoc sp.]|uniref:hypothetical protein n=1 Tax=Nostoc sp. TaxID=1180 RepID=UPI002FFAE524